MELLEGTYKLSSNFHDKEFKLLDKLIQKANKIVIFYHNGIDADAKGSTVAMMMGIQEKYHKNVEISKQGKHYELTSKDLVILLDVGDIFRLAGSFSGNPIISRIDHHPTAFNCPVNIQDISAGSTSELVTIFLTNYNYPIASKAAELLFQGIIADTGRLQYNISDTALLALSILKSQNVDYKSIYNKMYVKDSDDLKVRNYILNNYKISKNGLVYLFLDRERSLDAEIDMSRAGSHLHELSNIKGCPIWVLITDIGHNKITIRIRSRSIPINNIAEKYGGGGHEHAAAIRVKSKQQAKEILAELDKYIYEQRLVGVLKEDTDSLELNEDNLKTEKEYDNIVNESTTDIEGLVLDEVINELLSESQETRAMKKRLKLLLKSVKYVPDDVLNKNFPELQGKDHYAKVKALRYRISNLDNQKLAKLLYHPSLLQLEHDLLKTKHIIRGASRKFKDGFSDETKTAAGVAMAVGFGTVMYGSTQSALAAGITSPVFAASMGFALTTIFAGLVSCGLVAIGGLGVATTSIVVNKKNKQKIKESIPDIVRILQDDEILSEMDATLLISILEDIIDNTDDYNIEEDE